MACAVTVVGQWCGKQLADSMYVREVTCDARKHYYSTSDVRCKPSSLAMYGCMAVL